MQLFSQHASKNNYTGDWETPTSWIPTWAVPQTTNINNNITIYGLITRNGSLIFPDNSANLIVSDTLVIKGDLTIGHNDHLTISDNGILIIRGNLILDDDAIVDANGYLIVTGNINKIGGTSHQYIRSNDNPVKVFVGGTIDAAIRNKTWNPVFECTTQPSIPYPVSGCSYGVMADLMNDPIYPFFQSTCTIATPTITAGGPTTFCAGGSVNLTSSPGTTYLWSNGATSQSINVTISGSYTVKITNASGCQSAASVATVVTVNALPITPAITASGTTTFCAGGSVTLTSSAGTSYFWSNGATTQSINVTTAGSYSVRVKNASGCQSAASVPTTVTVNALPVTPTITAGGPTTFCAGGSVTLTSGAGTTYLWSNGAITAGINVTIAGSYNVQVTNANGCQSAVSAATLVNVNALPVVNAGADITIPNGTSTTINATVAGTGPFTYSWSPSAQLVNASIKVPTTVNLAATTVFTLTATSQTTSCSNTDVVTITISGGALNSTPTATPGTICAGANVQLRAIASGGSGSYTYTWTSTPVGFTSSIAAPIASPAVTTTYHVAVFDGFTTTNPQVAVTVNALPATPTITAGGPTTFCAGGNVTLTSSAGISYLWSNGATTPSINVSTAGSYNVQVTNASGCQSALSAATVVTVNALPVTPTITAGGPATFCVGGSVMLTSTAGTGYIWLNGATTQNINVTTSGSYSVIVINASGCQSAASVATVVTVNDLPGTPTISAHGPTTFCSGDVVTLTSSPEMYYLWSNGATTPSVDITTAGNYTVQLTNANGCQSAPSAATVVTVNALPSTPTIIANGPTTFCDGDNVTLSSSAGSTYLWSNGATTSSADITTAGNYTVQVSNASGCLSEPSLPILISVNPLPETPTISADGPTTFCTGGGVTLTSDAGTSYLWSNGATTSSVNVPVTGNFSVKISDANSCQSTASAVTIVTVNALPPTPAITAGGPVTFCTGGNVLLTSSSGVSYLWSNGANTAGINVSQSGSYFVKVTNSNGCQSASSASVVVTVNEQPVAIQGPDQELKYIFETTMAAELPYSGTGEWSLISGSGHIADIHSPATMISELAVGENTFLWNVKTGNCEAGAKVKITVLDLIVPSVITPDGDGKNDYFKISEMNGQVELIIFNSWGNREYSNSNYLNDWDGRNNRGAELPGDTYFYLLKFKNGKILKGSVLIKR